MRDSLQFLGTFLRNPASTGAVLPSSRYLARALVGPLRMMQPGDLILEYGPGTGAMTRVIAERLPPGARYLGIELDPGFVGLLRERYPDFEFVEGSAAEVESLLAERELPRPWRIVSGLPFASLPEDVREGVVRATADILDPDGSFRTFQYVQAYPLGKARRFRRGMRRHFAGFHRSAPILRNVPPAFVLSYDKPIQNGKRP